MVLGLVEEAIVTVLELVGGAPGGPWGGDTARRRFIGGGRENFQYRRRRPPAPGRLERGRRRVPRALGAHGGPVFPWLVVDDRPAS